MKKMGNKFGIKNRILCGILVIVMLLAVLPFNVFADYPAVTITLPYFVLPTSWINSGFDESNGDVVKFNVKYGDHDYASPEAVNTGRTYNGRAIYTTNQTVNLKYGDYHYVQFQWLRNGSWQTQIVYNAAGSWSTNYSQIDGRMYVADSGSWVDYTYDEVEDTPAMTVYFDATMSKIPYYGNDIGKTMYEHERDYTDSNWVSIPNIYNDDGSRIVYYYATGSAGAQSGIMTADENNENLYYVNLEENKGTKIVFSSQPLSALIPNSIRGGSTAVMDIPQEYSNPCFYADTGDASVYQNTTRGGYWYEKGYTYDAERYKDGADIVNVPAGTFPRKNDTLYVSTTLYDYYSDYEVSGYNRGSYPSTTSTDGNNRYRQWVSFRQFDQALSDAYSANDVKIPLYTGHFQPAWRDQNGYSWGATFANIAGSLGLYGYDSSNQGEFMSTNNSTMNVEGKGTDGSVGTGNGYYNYAAQGLVKDTLKNGNVMAVTNTSNTELVLPHFNESFLNGANSKNAVLGEVFHDVTFPFTSDTHDDGVAYWHFNSADTTLALKNDSSRGYFLDEVTAGNANRDLYRNLNSSGVYTYGDTTSTAYGFFPFNASATINRGDTYNFGFGMKMDINFHLTEDGTVLASDGETEVPITFRFSGDDDLWVFIDGKLALDVGGDHGKATGTLNFKDMTATVSAVKKSQGSNVEGTDVVSNFTMSGKKSDQHTLTFFYMERGMWESNLEIEFNFPDENQLVVEKKLNLTNVDELFRGLFDAEKEFTFNIQNLATHYGAWSGNVTNTGFRTPQIDIRDYGTATSGALANAEGAQYTKYATGAEAESGVIGGNGNFTLKNGQSAVFSDQFRRGSYIALQEVLEGGEAELYDTTWTMYGADGKPVTSIGSGNSVTNGSVTNLAGVSGRAVNDGRTENAGPSYREYQEGDSGNAYQQGGISRPENAFVFRSYLKPDETIGETVLKVEFENKVKVGSLTIDKTQAAGSKPLAGEYQFEIVFSNIGGIGLGDNATVTKTVTITGTGSATITGIPAGTEYIITEISPADGSVLKTIDGEEKTSVSGTVTANVTDTHTFANYLDETLEVTVTKIWQDETGTVITEDLPESIFVQVQYKVYDEDDWAAVSGYESVAVSKENYGGKIFNLKKYVDQEADPQVLYQYRVVEIKVEGENITVLGEGDRISFGDDNYIVSYGEGNAITNKKVTAHSLTVTKTVTGNMGSRTQKFNFTISIAKDGEAYSFDAVPEGLTATEIAGTYSFTLAHGESLTIHDLPDGAQYTIEETDATGYNVTMKIGEDDFSGTGTLNDDVTVSVVNSREGAVPTGVTVQGAASAAALALASGAALIGYVVVRKRKEEE